MSQSDTLRALDATIMAAFRAAGLADQATFRGQSVEVYLDRDAEVFGEDGAGVVGVRTLITLRLDQADTPERGDTVSVGDETWLLSELVQQDESMSTWVAVRE